MTEDSRRAIEAVAVGMAFGPAAGLEIVDSLRDEPTRKDLPR